MRACQNRHALLVIISICYALNLLKTYNLNSQQSFSSRIVPSRTLQVVLWLCRYLGSCRLSGYFIHHRPSRFTIGTTTCSKVLSPKQSIR